MRVVARAQCRLEPGMLVGGVIGHQVAQDLHPELVDARHELVEVVQHAVFTVDVVVVGYVVAMVLLG